MCIAYMKSNCSFSISISLPSFKPVALSLSRISSILKHPNKSNPIHIFGHLLPHTHCLLYIYYNNIFSFQTNGVNTCEKIGVCLHHHKKVQIQRVQTTTTTTPPPTATTITATATTTTSSTTSTTTTLISVVII